VQTWLLLADYQALTDRAGSVDLQDSIADIVLDYIAVGLDVQSDRGLAFRHSQVPELNQLMLPFLSLVSVSEIERNPTVKSEIETLGTGHVTGLMFNYPVHQAADILFCHGNLVPGGRDQLPHVEITRKIARTFNKTYSPRRRYFQEPVLLFGEAPMLLGTDGKKMGKSARNAIFIRDDEATTAAVLKKAVTDSDPHIAYDPVNRPTGGQPAAARCAGRRDDAGGGRRRDRVRRLGAAQGVRDRARSTSTSGRSGRAGPSSRPTRRSSRACSTGATRSPARPRAGRCARCTSSCISNGTRSSPWTTLGL
jgi:tryptophanyl-tRNA synthetase